jgi:hypothetical protein
MGPFATGSNRQQGEPISALHPIATDVQLLLAEREPIQVADLREEVTSDINEITLRAGYR